MAMQIILTRDVANLGAAGELVSVRPGYGRNYLVPRGMAVSATAANVHRLASGLSITPAPASCSLLKRAGNG